MARSGHWAPKWGTSRYFDDARRLPVPPSKTYQAIASDRRTAVGSTIMWDTVESRSSHLSHDLPCSACGHAGHTYLPCSDSCDCAHGQLLTAV